MVVSSAVPDSDALYAMHRRWLGEVLGSGDSLFTPGAAIWTADHLDELEREFTGQPDLTKGKRFLDKLRDQLAHASPEAIQLMAELHAVHFLIIWTAAISAAKKRSDLEAIVSWIIINAGGPPTDDKSAVTMEPPHDPDHVSSFLNIRVADIQAAYRQWRDRGAQFLTPPAGRGPELRCYMRDPDGHLIEVGQRIPG